MVTKIEIDGFKSLKNFELDLHEGLNILVGPNGSGKTNIVLFFEFLSKLVTMPVGNVIEEMGGFGFIFQKREKGYVDTIKIKIEGKTGYNNIENDYAYNYSFVLKISDDFENIIYTRQELIIINDIQRFLFNLIPENKTINIVQQTTNGKSIIEKKIQDEWHLRFMSNIIKNDANYFQETLLRIYNSFFTTYFPTILTDLKGGEIFNIIPNRIREQESAISLKGIQSDGYGLAKTLFEMQRGNGNNSNYNIRNFQKAIAYLKLANPAVHDLVIEKDDFDNKLVPKVYIKSDEKASILPMAFLSDGTLKWLTLVTAVLTSDHLFCIEEPENYLHPWMQAEMCRLMREHLEMKNEPSFILMTTHSETLLNAAKPEEVIVISMKNGETCAQRVENSDLLREIIADSGFGLGHLYLTNSLSDQ